MKQMDILKINFIADGELFSKNMAIKNKIKIYIYDAIYK